MPNKALQPTPIRCAPRGWADLLPAVDHQYPQFARSGWLSLTLGHIHMNTRSAGFTPPRYPGESLLNKQSIIFLIFTLILPVSALISEVSVLEYPVILIAPIAASLVSFYLVFSDKQKAKEKSWRTPESTLHISELLGGWPGSFVAQRYFRHKTSKASYQFVFWMIVSLYQIASFDSLQSWKWTIQLKEYLQQT